MMYSQANSFSREISRHYDSYFEDKGLTTSYVELLLIIDEHGSLSQKNIAEQMNLAPSTITRFISKLEKQGYLKKEKKGKLVAVSISKKKESAVKELRSMFNKANSDLVELLGDKYVETTSKLLNYGIDRLKE